MNCGKTLQLTVEELTKVGLNKLINLVKRQNENQVTTVERECQD